MHKYSVFVNSCINVPVDPISKMPKTAYERNDKVFLEQCSLDSESTYSISDIDLDAEKLKDFYRSIPDYNDINHLSETEFYCTLKTLREKKRIMFRFAIKSVDSNNEPVSNIEEELNVGRLSQKKISPFVSGNKKYDSQDTKQRKSTSTVIENIRKPNSENKNSIIKNTKLDNNKNTDNVICIKGVSKLERPKRNHSSCSISWRDDKVETTNDIQEKFDTFLAKNSVKNDDSISKTQSMPSSPLRNRRISLMLSKSKDNITIPKPFKMTQRDEDNKTLTDLRGLKKSFSEDMLHQKSTRRHFRARPVPIESRIPLYDKILEDKAMRRAITKINSEAELRAQMKPFSFTKREESVNGVCERVLNVLPKNKKKQRFRARPIPKNLFSNYFYEKMKEENFFRSMNRRIRAEELLRSSTYPGQMGTREHSRLSTPAAHSDLPTDPSPAAFSFSTIHRSRSTSPAKYYRKATKHEKHNLITTSPQPFRLNTAERAHKRINDISKKIGADTKSMESTESAVIGKCKIYSALDLRGCDGRSNLAALLRAEAAKKKIEMEASMKLADQIRRAEAKQRNRFLRSKPAWHLVKNNHEEDIAMRLQTRRDEERLRREEYFHELELMYGRVQRQPMLFERFYAPRSGNETIDYSNVSPRKPSPKKRNLKKCKNNVFSRLASSIDLNEDTEKILNKPINDSEDES